jgi:DNA polymerase III epsilon subunit-like protein
VVITFDVETSGLVVKDKPMSDPAQPRIVQLGFVVQDRDRRELARYSTLLRPDGWEINPEATRVHGYTTEDCSRWGADPKVALCAFLAALNTCRIVVAHSIGNDASLINRELTLLNAADAGLNRARLRRFCTMRTGAALMPDGKWPTLSRLHRILTGQDHAKAHDALGDAEATARCFWGMVDRRLIEL